MDQSQMPAQPTPAMSPGELVAKLQSVEPVVEGTAKENQMNAARELEMITELRSSRAFQWFEEEFIERPYREAFDALRTEDRSLLESGGGLRRKKVRYLAFKRVRIGMIERQLTHLELISPNDPMIAVLRATLDVL